MEKKELTVQDLINHLSKIKNKNIPVDIIMLDEGFIKIKPGDHIFLTEVIENKSIPSGKTVSVSIGTDGKWKPFDKTFDDFVSVEDSTSPYDKQLLEKTTRVMGGDRELAIHTLSHRKRAILAMNYGTTL